MSTNGLAKKEHAVAPELDEMAAVAKQLAPQFRPLGMTFRPENLLATVLQEADAQDPVTGISGDDGLGLMQITPYEGKLDPNVARTLHWDNAKSVSYNIAHSRWRDATANLKAGGETMIDKARAIKAGTPRVWSEMNDGHRWRATMYAYNAGQGAAIKALDAGGPNARMISTFTANGHTVSHDYTAELDEKQQFVAAHDPFRNGEAPTSTAPQTGGAAAPAAGKRATKPAAKGGGSPETAQQKHDGYKDAPTLADVESGAKVIELGMAGQSVEFVQHHVGTGADGEFGPVTQGRVRTYQAARALEADGVVGEHTLAAMKANKPAKPAPTPGHDPGKGGAGGGKGKPGKPHPPAPSGSDPVAIARHFLGMPSWDARLVEGIKGPGWHYSAVGGHTNNCAEFVTSVQRMAGRMSFQEINVGNLIRELPNHGWRQISKEHSKAGDIWACNTGGISHTVIVSAAGQANSIGADGGSAEYIKEEPMGYAGAVYFTKD